MALKNKLLLAETNKNLELRKSLDHDLYDGTTMNLLRDPQTSGPKLLYKEAELERLKLALQEPEIESVIGPGPDKSKIKEKYTLDMNEIEKLKLSLHEFVPEHPVLADRLREKNLILQIKLPKFYDKTVQDTIELVLVEHCASPKDKPWFSINKELKNSYPAKEIGIEKLSKSNITFTLLLKFPKSASQNQEKQIKNGPKTGKQNEEELEKPNSAFTTKVIAKGVFNLGNLLQQENFKFEGKVFVDSLVGLDKKKNELNADEDVKKKPGNKNQASKKPDEDILPKEVGYFKLAMSFINDNIRIVPLPPPPKPSDEEIRLEAERNRLASLKQSKVEMEKRLKDEPLLPICLFVNVIRASKIPNREDSKMKRNLYIQHKLYGTPDDISSPVFWNQNNPELDHRVVIPLTKLAIGIMKDVPFTISVWDKRDSPKPDELIGLVHLSLKTVYSLLWPMSEDDLRAMLAKQDLNLLELTNKYLAIEKLSSCSECGFLKVFAALGNIHQVSEYNSLHPANNSRMLGIDPTAFDFDMTSTLPRKRDLNKKKKVRLNEVQKAMLANDPAARHLVDTLVEQLNKDEIPMEQFVQEIHGLMKRHPDVRIVDAIKTIEKEAEICNPLESIDMSRKNYLKLGEPQLSFDHAERKYFQIWGDGMKTPLDKCYYVKEDGSMNLIFVDPEVVKVKRDHGGKRFLQSKQIGKLRKLGRYFNHLSEDEVREIERQKSERRKERERQAKAEEEKLQKQIDDAIMKLEETKALVETRKLVENKITENEVKKAEEKNVSSPKTTQEGPLRMNEAKKDEPNPPVGSGWNKARNKLSQLKKDFQREEDSYASPSARSIQVTSRSGKDKMYLNFVRVAEQPEDQGKEVSMSSLSGTKHGKQSESALSPRSIYKGRDSQFSGTNSNPKYNVIQVGMVLHDGRVAMYESSEDTSEENTRLKNINLIEKSDQIEEYDPTLKVPQYETKLGEDMEISDVLMSLTLVLEYIRREIIHKQELRKNLKLLLLGQFQPQMASGISFEDLEYLMEQYSVPISHTELQAIFSFFDMEGKNMISLHDIHDSLVSYMLLIKRFVKQHEGTFKYLLDKIENQDKGMERFTEFLSENSENYHIECRKVFKFLRDEYLVHDISLIDYQVREFGECLYFDQIYIYNILNMLLYLQASYNKNCNPQYIEGLFHYESFLPLILLRLRECAAKVFRDEPALEIIKSLLVEANNKEEEKQRNLNKFLRRQTSYEYDELSDKISNPVSLQFPTFKDLMDNLGFKELSVFEKMIIFYFIIDLKFKSRHTLDQSQVASMQEIYIFFQLVLGDNPEEIKKLINRQMLGSLASFINRELMFQESRVSLTHSRSESLSGQKKSKYLVRRKMKQDLVETERTLYRMTLNVQGIEGLQLPYSFDFCDFTVSFCYPGEENIFESQLFTYIPREGEYDLLLNTEHTFRCPSGITILDVFSQQDSLRFCLNKISLNRSSEIAYCLIPISDLLCSEPKSRKYFLYLTGGTSGNRTSQVGSIKIALAFFSDIEKLTQKDFFFSKHFIVNNQKVEKDVVFEREVPKKGYLTIQVSSLKNLEGFYTLFEEAKKMCTFPVHYSKAVFSILLKVSEVQKPISMTKAEKFNKIIEEASKEDEEESHNSHDIPISSRINTSERGNEAIKLFSDYVIELKTASMRSLESLFNFVDSFCSKPCHYIYHLSKFEIQLTPVTLSLLESSDIELELYLAYSGPGAYSEVKICGERVRCSQFLTLQNLQGLKTTSTLTSSRHQSVSCELDFTLNYTKSSVNDAQLQSLNMFRDIEATIELLKPLSILLDLTQIISIDDSLSNGSKICFLKTYLGQTLVQSSSMIEWKDTKRVVKWAKLNQQENKNLIEFKLNTLVEELDLGKVYSDFSQDNKEKSVRDFLLNYVPQLKIVLVTEDLDRSERQVASIVVDLKHLVKNSLESNILPSSVVYKGYLPFENFDPQQLESGDVAYDKTENETGRKMNISLRNSSVISIHDSQRESMLSNFDLEKPKDNLREQKDLTKTRLGLKLIFISSKGAFNNEAYDGFRLLHGQAWVKSMEDVVKILQANKFDLNESLFSTAKGFLLNREHFSQILAKEMRIGKVMASYILDLVGQERQTASLIKLYNLLSYPLDHHISIEDLNLSVKQVADLLDEFRHFDNFNRGYVPFGDAIKIVMNSASTKSLTMKQLQTFKHTELLKDFKPSMAQPIVATLDKTSFDYIIFLNELLEASRRFEVLNEGKITGMPVQIQLKLFNQNQKSLISPFGDGTEDTLRPAFKSNMRSPIRRKQTYLMNLKLSEGINIDKISRDPFPSTLVQLLPNFAWKQLENHISPSHIESEVVLRDPEPEWNHTLTASIPESDNFIAEFSKSTAEIQVLERTLNSQRGAGEMFQKTVIGKGHFKLGACIEDSEMIRFVSDDEINEITKELIVDLSGGQAAVKVVIRIAKIEQGLDQTIPKPSEYSADSKIEMVLKTLQEMQNAEQLPMTTFDEELEKDVMLRLQDTLHAQRHYSGEVMTPKHCEELISKTIQDLDRMAFNLDIEQRQSFGPSSRSSAKSLTENNGYKVILPPGEHRGSESSHHHPETTRFSMRDGHNDTAKFDEPSAQDVFNWVPPVFASLTKRESLFAKAEDKNHLFNKENAGFQSFAEPQDESSFGGRLETHNALSSVPEYKDTNSLDLNP